MTPLPINKTCAKEAAKKMALPLAEREKRAIKKEQKRLTEIYAEVEEKKRNLVIGLIENAAFARVKLQSLAADIQEFGWTEMFSQSEKQEPYSRRRPEADLYNTLLANYLKYIKQLNDLLPKSAEGVQVQTDGFDEFVNERLKI